jgi:hypothetical protein
MAYAVVAAVLTWRVEGALLREAVGYLRRSRAPEHDPPVA